ncbi:arylamine N-acetyltransferase 1 [Acephala macrosclerotiorum]|nr:arylamine N-acetyltransferase 1 [Acephala macrosclerotiorum]
MELELSKRASAYSPEQIAQFEEHVNLPQRYRQSSKPALDINYLTVLHVHQIANVPYENLVLHYSTSHAVSLNPQVLFQKIVGDKRGRGGYCMENSIFFNHVLRGLGFKVYTVGVKIRPRVGGVPGGNYTGWVHIVNIVTLPTGEKYHLDVGFGGDGATHPLPLIDGHESINLGTQVVRLIHSPIPCNVDQSQKWWIYQYRNSPTQEWNSFYAFAEFEFTEADFGVMNWWTSASMDKANFQTRRVLVVKFLLGRVGDEIERGAEIEEQVNGEGKGKEGIVGKIMLMDEEVKRNDGGRTKVVAILKSEEERVKAFKELFDIDLTEEEIEGVKGRIIELKR